MAAILFKHGRLYSLLFLLCLSSWINETLCNSNAEKSQMNKGSLDFRSKSRERRWSGTSSTLRTRRQTPESPTLSDFGKMYNKIMQMEERLNEFITKTDESIDKADKEIESNREYIYNLSERLIMIEDQLDGLNNSFARELKALRESLQDKTSGTNQPVRSTTRPTITTSTTTKATTKTTTRPTTTTKPRTTTTRKPSTAKQVSTTIKRSTDVQGITFAPAVQDDYNVVCHYDTSASTIEGGDRFQPEDIDAKLCTDIIYDNAILDETKLLIKSNNPELDIDKNFYRRVVSLKKYNSDLKVYLSLGGWVDSAGDKYSKLARDERKRQEFATDTANFLKKYGFDGLDLAWMYPVCWQGNCNAGLPEDRLNYVHLLENLKEVFDRQTPRLRLSAVVHAHSYAINKIYHVPAIVDLLDRIEVKTYGYRYPSDDKTTHLAPLHSYKIGKLRMTSVSDSVNYWLRLQVPPKKLHLAIPAYGRIFNLANPTVNGLGAPITGGGSHINYNHLCEKLKQPGWTVLSDVAAGSYAFKGNEWIGYVGPEDAARLAKFAREQKLGGVTLLDITDDDYNTFCCSVRYPLLTAINIVLRHRERSALLKQLGCPAAFEAKT